MTGRGKGQLANILIATYSDRLSHRFRRARVITDRGRNNQQDQTIPRAVWLVPRIASDTSPAGLQPAVRSSELVQEAKRPSHLPKPRPNPITIYRAPTAYARSRTSAGRGSGTNSPTYRELHYRIHFTETAR